MSKVYHDRSDVHSIQYHLVWCVKYRRDVLIECKPQHYIPNIVKAFSVPPLDAYLGNTLN